MPQRREIARRRVFIAIIPRRAPRQRTNPLADAYRTLGVKPSASDDEVKRAYREKAKSCHPDVLRSQGASDRKVAEATEKMAKVNAAWTAISKERNI